MTWRFLTTMLLGCCPLYAMANAEEARPNFLVFIADDMATSDCGAYGHPHIRTPNLDRLAEEGLTFDQAFLTCSSCSPSRASILTGRYPHSTGAHQLHLPLPKDQVLVSAPLRQAGYYAAAAGKWHLGNPAKSQFDRIEEGRVDLMVDVLRDRPKDQPFFFWFGFIDPHRPYAENTIQNPHSVEDVVVPPFLPDTDAVRRDLAMYYDEITRMDRHIGEVLNELSKQGAAENTVVVFLSDNGRPFPRCKTTVYDSGIQTPLIIRWPQGIPAGKHTSALMSSVDLAPTLCQLAGTEVPKSFQGRSFAPLLAQPEGSHRDNIFAEHNWHDYESRQRAVRTAKWKYIRDDYADLPNTPPADAVRSPTFTEMQRLLASHELSADQQAVFTKPRPAEELFDTENDPFELRNLADDPQYAEELDDMRARLNSWQEETADVRPKQRRPDQFDRVTGEPLKKRRKRTEN